MKKPVSLFLAAMMLLAAAVPVYAEAAPEQIPTALVEDAPEESAPTAETPAETAPEETPDETEMPEETAIPVETEMPAETVTPEETTAPEETAAPEETTATEETTAPEETAVPEETTAPEETTEPEETTVPEETEAPEETAEPTKTPTPTAAPQEMETAQATEESAVMAANTSGYWEYSTDTGVAVITGYTGTTSSVTIPYSLGGYIVRSIGKNAFKGKTTLRSVVIPEQITSIGNGAFSGCTNLSSVTINATDLADCSDYSTWDRYTNDSSVFYNAGTNTSSMTVTFGEGVKRVPAYLFATGKAKGDNVYCHVTTVKLSSAVTEVGQCAFYNCYALKSVSWGGVRTICESAFKGTALTSLALPNTLVTIGPNAFRDNSTLPSVSFPSSLATIDEGAFRKNTALKTVVIPKDVVKLGNGAFADCTNLSSVTINATDLADCSDYSTWDRYTNDSSVFYNAGTNTSSMTVTFGEGVKRVPAYLFATGKAKGDNVYCNVTSVKLSSTVKEVGNHAFFNCFNLKSVSWGGVQTIGKCAFENDSALTKLVFPSSLNAIDQYAFKGNTSLSTLTLPVNLKRLGNNAFANCTYLSSVTINATDLADCDGYSTWDRYTNDSSVFYNTGTNVNSMTVTFGARVQRIPAYLFATGRAKGDNVYCHVTEVTIPASVKTVGKAAFFDCYDLAKVTVNSRNCTFEDDVFTNCTTPPTFNCYRGSAVAQYAIQNGLSLKYLPMPSNYTGLWQGSGAMKYYKQGVLQSGYSGLVKNTDGYLYYVQKGTVQTGKTGLVLHTNGVKYYVKRGVLQNTYTGIVIENGTRYFVCRGIFQGSKTGLVRHTNGKLYYVKRGVVQINYTGFVSQSGRKYYVVKAIFQNASTGLVRVGGKSYYVAKGVLQEKRTGVYRINGTRYFLVSGIWQEGSTGRLWAGGKVYNIRNGIAV